MKTKVCIHNETVWLSIDEMLLVVLLANTSETFLREENLLKISLEKMSTLLLTEKIYQLDYCYLNVIIFVGYPSTTV